MYPFKRLYKPLYDGITTVRVHVLVLSYVCLSAYLSAHLVVW